MSAPTFPKGREVRGGDKYKLHGMTITVYRVDAETVTFERHTPKPHSRVSTTLPIAEFLEREEKSFKRGAKFIPAP